MKEIEINKRNLEIFCDNLRAQDREELIYFLGDNYKEKFIDLALSAKGETYFLQYNSIPSCIGGSCEDTAGAQIWLLCAQNYDKTFLFRYINKKLKIFKNKYKYLYNYIYKSNFKLLKWLTKSGFKVKDTKDTNLKLFYYRRD